MGAVVGAGDAVVADAVVTLATVGGTVGAEVGVSARHLDSEKKFSHHFSAETVLNSYNSEVSLMQIPVSLLKAHWRSANHVTSLKLNTMVQYSK